MQKRNDLEKEEFKGICSNFKLLQRLKTFFLDLKCPNNPITLKKIFYGFSNLNLNVLRLDLRY